MPQLPQNSVEQRYIMKLRAERWHNTMGHACRLSKNRGHTLTHVHDERMVAVAVDIGHISRLISRPQRVWQSISPQRQACAAGLFAEAVERCRGGDF